MPLQHGGQLRFSQMLSGFFREVIHLVQQVRTQLGKGVSPALGGQVLSNSV